MRHGHFGTLELAVVLLLPILLYLFIPNGPSLFCFYSENEQWFILFRFAPGRRVPFATEVGAKCAKHVRYVRDATIRAI